jgi:hypothetical protein
VSLTAGTHSDTVFGTALRRACGASCIRLRKTKKTQKLHQKQQFPMAMGNLKFHFFGRGKTNFFGGGYHFKTAG